MKKLLFLIIFNVIVCSFSYAQGIIRGKVTDENGESVIGAIIRLKSNLSVGTTADLDGNYSLKIAGGDPQVLVVSYLSYKTIEAQVHPINGEVIVKNFVLVPEERKIDEAVVTGKAVRGKDHYMENLQKNSPTSLNYISSETMKRTGDANVVAAVARISGVSTNSGFITVRGIGDRYIKTTINGSRIPTLDPFTNNIQLDMFPSSLVDNVVITKTANPDLPGDWSGAYLSIETKDYPTSLSINVETSFGYRQSTFKDMLTTQRSATDWLGFDNGFRDRDHSKFEPYYCATCPNTLTPYKELVSLGMGDYLNSLGVKGHTSNAAFNEAYFKLALVQLGLLGQAQFYDEQAISQAKIKYNEGPYKQQAFNIYNAGAAETGQSFPNNWNLSTRKAPVDFSQSFSIGNQSNLFGRALGYLVGFRYGSSYLSDPVSAYKRSATTNVSVENGKVLPNNLTESFDQNVSTETNGWSALMNVAYNVSPNHSVSLLFMPNLTGVNKARADRGYILSATTYPSVYNQDQFYEERKQLVYQFKSEHYIPGPRLKLELNASYTDGESSAPDFKTLQYGSTPDAPSQYTMDNTVFPNNKRNYRYLLEDLFDSRLSAELPVGNKAGLTRKIKFGGAYQHNTKDNKQYIYRLMSTNSDESIVKNNDFDDYFSLDNFGITDGTIRKYYYRSDDPSNFNFGYSTVKAGFIMLDYAFTTSLRFSGGLRVEQADIFTDVRKYYDLQLPAGDPERIIDGRITNPGKMDKFSYLPSANIIYKLKQDESAPLNLRLNYSHTVARPSIRELSDTYVYDFELRKFVTGNPSLQMVNIRNYDLRLESYFRSGDNLSLSLFYKDFKNHIELVETGASFSWDNAGKSRALGVELEGKKNLLKSLELRANITLVDSRSTFVKKLGTTVLDTVTRAMFGQAPYILNGIVAYTADKFGISAAITYNLQGPRLVVAAVAENLPDVYELPRHLVDFRISKSLAKYFTINLKIRDLLNTTIRRTYKHKEGWLVDFDNYHYGTSYILGFAYKL